MNYSCIGFDVRVWPVFGVISSESSLWEQNYEVEKFLSGKYGLENNSYQLLEINDPTVLESVCIEVENINDCNLVAIFIPAEIAIINFEKFGLPFYGNFDFLNSVTLGWMWVI